MSLAYNLYLGSNAIVEIHNRKAPNLYQITIL
jgi:hypothetical protein